MAESSSEIESSEWCISQHKKNKSVIWPMKDIRKYLKSKLHHALMTKKIEPPY